MPRILHFNRYLQRFAARSVESAVQPSERPEDDDSPPPELSTERYAAWSATSVTAVYGFVPFSSPGAR